MYMQPRGTRKVGRPRAGRRDDVGKDAKVLVTREFVGNSHESRRMEQTSGEGQDFVWVVAPPTTVVIMMMIIWERSGTPMSEGAPVLRCTYICYSDSRFIRRFCVCLGTDSSVSVLCRRTDSCRCVSSRPLNCSWVGQKREKQHFLCTNRWHRNANVNWISS
jgi:hypothetical protein